MALLSLSTLVLQAGSQGSSSSVPEINSSILLVGPSDIDTSSGTSRCMQMVGSPIISATEEQSLRCQRCRPVNSKEALKA